MIAGYKHGRFWGLTAAFQRNRDGVSAIEFSLFAPILMLGFVAVSDLAFLAQQKMSMDHVLRAAAQEAMKDKSASSTAPEVTKILNLVAAEGFAVGSTTPVGGKPPLTVSASRYCVCPDNISGPHLPACAAVCTGEKLPVAFYEITAESRSTSMILPSTALKSKIQVQVR
ncbi:TadE/TadG family type IV pilus assembly protein [Microvirga guangxiensis]|uniref:TadE/TadG family type IV pilus assembly protein n=1 Tax=Microvirga guangxiensis TaxID=549386 RepID=UPI0015874CB0|nr:TadE/TadG family type IV pilus assembly protein [Microvirga guangxiensis]